MAVLSSCVAINMIVMGFCVLAAEQKTSLDEPVMFSIPAQPLADALVAYETASGAEVYYDGMLAVGRRSTAVQGSFAPVHGLEILLDGTGYQPRRTGADTFTLIPAQHAELSARVSPFQLRQHDRYFAALQAAIANALCDIDTGTEKQIIFSFRVAGTGAVYRVEIFGADESSPGSAAALVERINKVNIGSAPPTDVPQPITMAVYPPSRQDASGCLPSADRETGR